jgi:hypothetical protein
MCFPDDREQSLCVHHALRATPLGSFELIEDYTVEKVLENLLLGRTSAAAGRWI